MTHIHISIQDDSLAMLDTLLAATPLLVAANADTVLHNFLDMISSLKSDSSSERTLTVNLSSRFTSIEWRMKVLRRLKGLLSALVEYKNQQDEKHFGYLAHPSENTACLHGKLLMFVFFLITFLWELVNVQYQS
jgi:pre-rRNA-processing protein IPI1